MSQQTGYTGTPPLATGLGASSIPALIPNGQPPQWTKPPISYSAKHQRPPLNVQRPQSSSNPFATNGTETPQNPGSLSSQSSRDPSPTPPSAAPNLSSSTPNLTILDGGGQQFGRTHVLPSNTYAPPQAGCGSPLRTVVHGSSHPHLTAAALPNQQVHTDQRYSPALQQMGFPASHINGPNVGAPSSTRIVRTNAEGTIPRSGVQDGSVYASLASKSQEIQRQMPYTAPAVTQQQIVGQPPFHLQLGQKVQGDIQTSGQVAQPGQLQFQPLSSSYSGSAHQKFPGADNVNQSLPAQQSLRGMDQVFQPQPSRQHCSDQSPSSQQKADYVRSFDKSLPQVGQTHIPGSSYYLQSPSDGQKHEVNQSLRQPPPLTRTSLVMQPLMNQQFPPTVINQPQVQLPDHSSQQRFAMTRVQGSGLVLRPPLSQSLIQNSESLVGKTQGEEANQLPGRMRQLPSESASQQPFLVGNLPTGNNQPVNQYPHVSASQSRPPSTDSYTSSAVGQVHQQQLMPSLLPEQSLIGQYQAGVPGPALSAYSNQRSAIQVGNQHQQQTYRSGPPPPPLTQFPPPIQRNQDQGQHLSVSQGPTQTVHPAQQQQQQYQHNSGAPWLNTPMVDSQQQQQQNHHLTAKRYPQQAEYQATSPDNLPPMMSGLSITQQGFNKLWGQESYDLLQNRNILPPEKIEPPKIRLHQEFLDSVNCSSEIFRCTLTKIPETSSLLQKSRLPLGVLIHPFKDLSHLPVIQCNTIVRCRSCRTYINPFVYFVDNKRWKCNLCFRANELPEEFQFDPVSKSFGDPSRRPEIKTSTIEYIAPSEYMLRPPQPAVYLFLLDVSALAVESGYLQIFCKTLLEELDRLPGDGRTAVGFITFDSTIHFYSLAEGLSQPHQMIVVDTDDVFLPCPDNLLVNLAECRELVRDLLQQLPQKFAVSHDSQSVLGAALQAAHKLISPTGGRVTVFQSCLPNRGPGALSPREDPSQRAGKDAPHLNPATDFYKRLALDYSGHQVAVDLFIVNSQYCDIATISGISRFSGGCIHHFPLFKASNVLQTEYFQRSLSRYLTRKIGFEAVMRIRCSRGLAIHTFHGNFFVRSTDLLSLPNVNPDAGFGMQISIEESLTDLQNVCFQAALLYTSSKGERRIRVHTLCLPVATSLTDILYAADQQCIVGLLAKMAVDRSHESSLSDARDAFINVAIDVLSAYRLAQGSAAVSGGLIAPFSLRLLPLYILALLKYAAFRTGQSTRLDDRLFAMCQMKSLPLSALIQSIYPDMYPIHSLSDQGIPQENGEVIPQPPRLHLSAEKLDFRGAFLMDTGDHLMVYIGRNIGPEFCMNALGIQSFSMIPENMYELPELETTESGRIRRFINHLQSEKPAPATLEIIRDDSPNRGKFLEQLIEDRTDSALSYYEFLQHLKSNIK